MEEIDIIKCLKKKKNKDYREAKSLNLVINILIK